MKVIVDTNHESKYPPDDSMNLKQMENTWCITHREQYWSKTSTHFTSRIQAILLSSQQKKHPFSLSKSENAHIGDKIFKQFESDKMTNKTQRCV